MTNPTIVAGNIHKRKAPIVVHFHLVAAPDISIVGASFPLPLLALSGGCACRAQCGQEEGDGCGQRGG